jgi:hypothetical protein
VKKKTESTLNDQLQEEQTGKKDKTHKIRKFREFKAARETRNEKEHSACITRPWYCK